MQKHLNIEKIIFKVVLSDHITNIILLINNKENGKRAINQLTLLGSFGLAD